MKKSHCCKLPPTDLTGFFRRSRLATLITTPLILGLAAHAPIAEAKDYFNPNSLESNTGEQKFVDLSQFSSQGGQIPGNYRVDIYVNDSLLSTRDVDFVDVDGKLLPQLTAAQLAEMGVKLAAFPALQQLAPAQTISELGKYIPDAASTLNFSQLRLDISIPQAALSSEARGYVDPSEWDQGLNAALLNYNISGANTRRDSGGTDNNYYLNLRSGLNFNEWRLRNYSVYNDSNGRSSWQSASTFLQRDIQSLKGQLTVGDSATSGDIFASVQFRGAQLASDDNMYPDSLKGFAPVVRGIARSNARVTVRQNGFIIYQTYVAPGAFVISDLYPTSSSGDLEVVITEADGSEGRWKYAVSGGQYRSPVSGSSKPGFLQSTLIYGLPQATTVYGGLLLSGKYASAALGLGHGFGDWGSVSADVTHARTALRDSASQTGQSYRLRYAKDLAATGTTFTLAGYRYSTAGFYDFTEANYAEQDVFGGGQRLFNKRSRAELNVNQSLQGYGNFYLNGFQQDYWRQNGYQRSLVAGYNGNFRGFSYGIGYTYSQVPSDGGRNGNHQQLAFNVQIPLGGMGGSGFASYDLNTSKQGVTRQEVGLSGSALEDNNLNYNVRQSYADGHGAGSLNAGYKASYGEASLGYNYGNGTQQVNYGLQGGIVAHPYGVTFSQQQGETMTLVRAPGAAGVKVQNNSGVSTDWRGYAVVPYVSTYRKNRIGLDTQSLADNIDLENTTRTVIPTSGALVLANFKTRIGSRALIALSYLGKPAPFGATAVLMENGVASNNTGIVGLNGEVYLSGVPDIGELQLQWTDGSEQQCKVSFSLPPPVADAVSALRTLRTSCQ
ncbi:outer membrane usher protein [Collimonas sp. PA-H2]|uniref:fimbria/pilus outer membrane usher protein n=1 Tax=Collimonas sp. PA-H2 TaxID=1881062 RepID=UPI000C00F092|nr:fimbria/pilus outer membrane usher protein [Collimonas sp. PA-H2]PFH11520.1 outer membrane usher protein [Collimonas sp. PA-H2]